MSITPSLPEPVPEPPTQLSLPESAPAPLIQPSLPEPLSRSRCNPLCRHKENARNLVVCIDGTSNRFGKSNTNVVKLFAKIDLETTSPKQFAYYSSGIGTHASAWNVYKHIGRAISDKFEMAIAWNVKEIVKDAYGWLARTYQEGDKIYLFGFSRGAYQVRVLAGMIHEVGLIRTPTEKQIDAAYDHFRVIDTRTPKTRQFAREFKHTFSWKDVRVHFVGVWDTVSSVGLIRGDIFLSTSSSAAHACHFRHALALDERRVKFMPEYFHEMNSQMSGEKHEYIVPSNIERFASPTGEATTKTDSPATKKDESTEIKEVWFAGTHSDVGGKTRSKKSRQAGNVSLLWMRHEAIRSGLKLQPTDIVWVPDDIDFGTKDSMCFLWKIVEYIPIKHQVCFSGPGEDRCRQHRQRPRRIIPGQKVHASILYANAYKPKAKLGEGFDIPAVLPEEAEWNDQIWETGMFDGTAAEVLLKYLDSKQGVAPIYLDRLLFMLRFEEGKACVRNASTNSKDLFMKLISNPDSECAPLVKLVAIVAYYEAYANPTSPALACDLSQDIFDNARNSLHAILTKPKHRDVPRVLALLRALTRHQTLQERILTEDILEQFINLIDTIIAGRPLRNFEHAMNGLICLLQCKDKRGTIVDKLGANRSNSQTSRLDEILVVHASHPLTAALRMVLTLARIPAQEVPDARRVCSTVKRRLVRLARRHKCPVGLLAVEILIALYDSNDRWELGGQWKSPFSDTRANVATTFRLQPERHNSDGIDPGQQMLRQLFGLDAESLNDGQRGLIEALAGRYGVKSSDVQKRTASTLTLLKLCEAKAIRNYLCETGLVNVFIEQLRRCKDAPLLAAYALAIYDMMHSIKESELLPKYIVRMVQLDYFDDAVGPVEGFQIFGHLMRDAELREKIMKCNVPIPSFGRLMQFVGLREKIKNYNVTEVLNEKLRKGTPKETRTSLICLDIFRSYDKNSPWTAELVKKSLENLRKSTWKAQKAGATILSALSQTDHGVAAIRPCIVEIAQMLLPECYLPNEAQISPTATTTEFSAPPDASTKLSSMMGPACALRILAQNEELRRIVRETTEYGTLKDLHLSGTLVNEEKTKAWEVYTPSRRDVVGMLDKMIKAVDQELLEGGLMSVEDDMLPHIQHWKRLIGLVCGVAVGIPLALLGVSTAIAVGAICLALETPLIAVAIALWVPLFIVILPIMAAGQVRSKVLRRNSNSQPEDRAHGGEEHDGEGAASGGHAVTAELTGSDTEGTSGGGHAGKNSRGVETMQRVVIRV